MEREDPLHALSGHQAPHHDGATDARPADGDHRTGEYLDPLLLALLDQVVDTHGVSHTEVGDLRLHLLELELPHQVHDRTLLGGARSANLRVGFPCCRETQGLCPAPSVYRVVVPGQKYFRNPHLAEMSGPRVVGVVQESVRERLQLR